MNARKGSDDTGADREPSATPDSGSPEPSGFSIKPYSPAPPEFVRTRRSGATVLRIIYWAATASSLSAGIYLVKYGYESIHLHLR